MPLNLETKSALQRAVRAIRPQLINFYAASDSENAELHARQALLDFCAAQFGNRSVETADPAQPLLEQVLGASALQQCWQDPLSLGWVHQFWNDPSREALDRKVLNRHKMHTAVLLPERLRLDFGFPQVTPALQKQFDRDVKLARGFFAVSPGAIKFMPPYLEASHRIRGESTDLVTRFSNRILYGQPLLVS